MTKQTKGWFILTPMNTCLLFFTTWLLFLFISWYCETLLLLFTCHLLFCFFVSSTFLVENFSFFSKKMFFYFLFFPLITTHDVFASVGMIFRQRERKKIKMFLGLCTAIPYNSFYFYHNEILLALLTNKNSFD